jgi:hypothetical protein
VFERSRTRGRRRLCSKGSRTGARRGHRRRAATHVRPASSTSPTHGEHRGLPSLLPALFALSALPVGVPSSRHCLGAPRRRLPKDDAAPCSAGKVQGRGYPKPCAPDEPVRAGALGCPAGELGSSYPRRAAPSSLDAPRASRLWFVVLAVAPFWWWSGETRWRSRRTPALNPGRDPPPLPGVCEGAG